MKKRRILSILGTLCIAVLFCILLFVQYNSARSEMVSITIDGKEVRMGALSSVGGKSSKLMRSNATGNAVRRAGHIFNHFPTVYPLYPPL